MKETYLLWSKVMTEGLRALVAFIGGDWIGLIGEADIQFLVGLREISALNLDFLQLKFEREGERRG